MKILRLSATNHVTVWISAESRKYNKLYNKGMWNILIKMNYAQSRYTGTFFDGAELYNYIS
jgi:hypothetical protein